MVLAWPVQRGGRDFLAPEAARITQQFEAGGPLVVLVPGLGSEAAVFTLVAAELERLERSHLAVEPPGFGYIASASCAVTLVDAAEAAFASGFTAGRPTVYVGHSAGAIEAVELARCDPQAIGLVLVNGTMDQLSDLMRQPWRWVWRQPVRALRLASLLGYLSGWLPEFILRRLEQPRHPLTWLFWPLVARPWRLDAAALTFMVRHNRCPGAWRQLRANRHHDFPSRAAAVQVPLMVIHGRHDPLATKPADSRFVVACQRRGVVRVEELNCGHHGLLEAPQDVARLVTEFVSSLSMAV